MLTNKVCVKEALEVVAGEPQEDQEARHHGGAPCDSFTCTYSDAKIVCNLYIFVGAFTAAHFYACGSVHACLYVCTHVHA
jgi:hypothetical protein